MTFDKEETLAALEAFHDVPEELRYILKDYVSNYEASDNDGVVAMLQNTVFPRRGRDDFSTLAQYYEYICKVIDEEVVIYGHCGENRHARAHKDESSLVVFDNGNNSFHVDECNSSNGGAITNTIYGIKSEDAFEALKLFNPTKQDVHHTEYEPCGECPLVENMLEAFKDDGEVTHYIRKYVIRGGD